MPACWVSALCVVGGRYGVAAFWGVEPRADLRVAAVEGERAGFASKFVVGEPIHDAGIKIGPARVGVGAGENERAGAALGEREAAPLVGDVRAPAGIGPARADIVG